MIRYRSHSGRLFTILALAVAGVVLAATATAEKPEQTQDQKIYVTADKLVSNNKDGYAEFSGNVEAVQGDFSMRADSVRIYYRQAAESAASSDDAIDKIVAAGNVKIRSQDREAETERAEYNVGDGTLVLTGENSTVTDGKNMIRGTKIRLNRTNNQISVEGDDANRVRAIFYPSEDFSLTDEKKTPAPKSE